MGSSACHTCRCYNGGKEVSEVRKRKFWKAAVVGAVAGVGLALAACGGKGAPAPPPESAPETSPSSVSCPGEAMDLPAHMQRWSLQAMPNEWLPLRIRQVPEEVTPSDIDAIYQVFRCFEAVWRVASIRLDPDVLRRADVAIPGYIETVAQRAIDAFRAKGETEIEVGNYKPVVLDGRRVPPNDIDPETRGRLLVRLETCRTYSEYHVDIATGEERNVQSFTDRRWVAALVKGDDGRWRISDYTTVSGQCSYDQLQG